MATARSRWLAAVAGMATLGAGCGSGASKTPAKTTASSAAHAAAVGVIRGWSDALRRGDVNAAARYFALPSEFDNGGAVSIHTEAQARAVNASLPCGAVLVSTTPHGRFISALFRLTDRPGPNGGCGLGTGSFARTNFIIAGGRIVDWVRAPDSGGGTGPGPSPPSTTPGPIV